MLETEKNWILVFGWLLLATVSVSREVKTVSEEAETEKNWPSPD